MRNLNPELKIVIGNFDSSINIFYICNSKTILLMKKIFIILSLMVLCSCKEWGAYYEAYHEHFITDYFTYNNINVEVFELPAVPEWGQDYNYRYVAIYADIDDCYHYKETDESRKAIYEQLAEKYGDIGFNRTVGGSSPYLREKYAAESITKIELICLEDVGENHPAGSSVAEMFEIECRTPYDYIQSHYTDFYNKKIVKRLDQLTEDDLYLIGLGDKYLFIIIPLNQEHSLVWGKKLRLTLNYENQYPISKDFVFEKGKY